MIKIQPERVQDGYTVKTTRLNGRGTVTYQPEGVELTFEQIDDITDAIIIALKNWLPVEAQTPAIIENLLGKTKEKINHLQTNL